MTTKTKQKIIELTEITNFIHKNKDALYKYFVTEWSSSGALQYSNIPALLWNCIVIYTYNHQDNGIPANVEQIRALVDSWNTTIQKRMPSMSNTSPLSKGNFDHIIRILLEAESPVERVEIATSGPATTKTIEIDTEKKGRDRKLSVMESEDSEERQGFTRHKRTFANNAYQPRRVRHQVGAQIRHKKEAVGNIAVSSTFDSSGDEFVTNEGADRDCMATMFSPGFDPYIKVTYFTNYSMKAHSTNCIFNVKRACIWREEDQNVMKWKVRKCDLPRSVLRFCCYDEEIGPDTLTGGQILYLGDIENFEKVGDTCVGREVILKRYGEFCGALTIDLSIRKKKEGFIEAEVEYCVLKVVIKFATKLKKERSADVSADGSVAIFSGLGFVTYLVFAGWLFEYLESDDPNSNIKDWWDGFWFVFVTATTVGYGDKYPITTAGLYVNCFIILIDVIIIGFIISIFLEYVGLMMEKKRKELAQSKKGNILADETVIKYLIAKQKDPEVTPEKICKVRKVDENCDEEPDWFLDLKDEERDSMMDMMEGKENNLQLLHELFDEFGVERPRLKQLINWYFKHHNRGRCQVLVQDFLDDWAQILYYTLFVIIMGILGSVFWVYEEGFPWDESFHLCFATMSTVGYGDIAPITDGGRAFCLFYILVGVGTITKLGTLLFDGMMDGQQEKVYKKIGDELLMHEEQLAEMDIDKTGKVNRYEFMRHLLMQMGKAREADFLGIQARFDQMDADKTGTISKDDFELLAKQEAEQKAQQMALIYS